jgi:protein-tyrosine phosphatase
VVCWCRRSFIALAAFLLLGNAVIYGAAAVANATVSTTRVDGVEGVDKLRSVDGTVWRGAAPTEDGYRSLAEAGVTVVVDLRAEEDAADKDELIESLGVRVVHLPIRDGQLPSAHEVSRFLAIVEKSKGFVFLHCGAGVGRTGAMAAAYVNATGQANGPGSLAANLSVGPPSLEQIVFAAGGADDRPNPLVVGVSRFLDSPRRLLAIL